MATASFNGIDLGLAPTSKPMPLPYRVQRNYFAGSDGPQSVRLGVAGTEITISGRIAAASAAAFGALYNGFLALMDGNVYSLTDTYGLTWPFTELVGVAPAEDRVRYDPVQLGYNQRVTFKFFSHT